MASRKGLSTLLTAALAVVAHVVFLLAPATCACAAERPAPRDAAPAHACCCKPGAAPMSCHDQGKTPAPAEQSPGKGCASSHASCQAEPPQAVAPSEAQASLVADAIAPAVAELVLPPAPQPVASFAPADTGPGRATPIGLVLTRTSILLI